MEAQGKQPARWEPLWGGAKVLVTREHGFGTDGVLLADFSRPRPGETWADLGTGCGIIPLLWRARGWGKAITGVELQPEAAELARQSVEENGYGGEISIVEGDARQLEGLFAAGSLDGISCNPPYTAPGAGIPSPGAARRTARQGDSLSLEDLARGARYALRFGGRLCLCLRPARLGEAMALFHGADLEPKRLRLVQQRAEKAPFLFLLECRRGGRPGMTVEPVLLLEDETGGPSRELEEIYGDYRDNPEHRGRR